MKGSTHEKATETRITKQLSLVNNLNLDNQSYEFATAESSSGGTPLYIANHLSYVVVTWIFI